MLTSEQIEAAKADTEWRGSTDATVDTVNALADAYARVAGLADNYETMTTLDQDEHRRNMQIAAAIRRALTGG